MKNILFIFVISLAFQFSSCSDSKQDVQEKHEQVATAHLPQTLEITASQYRNAEIETGPLSMRNLSESVRVTGKIDIPPQNYAEVSTYIGAVVKSILSVEGNYVNKGQVVMIMEHPEIIKLQEAYLAARNNMHYLEKEFKRQKELYSQQVNSAKVFEEAESKYRVEQGRMASLESQLQMLNISLEELNKGNISKSISLRAPVSGYIGHIRAGIGAYIDPNKVLFDIINLDEVHLHLYVFEKDVAKVKVGQKVYATIPNRNNELIEARVFNIGKLIDDDTRAIDVHADILKKNEGLIPGLFVNAQIESAGREVASVPVDAVVRNGGHQYIFVLDSDETAGNDIAPDAKLHFSMVEVNTGASDAKNIEIVPLEPLSPNAKVVQKGAYYLISQLKSSETGTDLEH